MIAMVELNPLPPSLREKYRYVVFEIISKKEFDLGVVVNAIWNAVLQLYGEVGASELSLWMPSDYYNKKEKKGIVRTNHMSVEKLRLALASIKQIENESVTLRIIGVTGTIRSAKNKFLKIVDLKSFSKSENE